MQKKISILGATGSIGTSALEIVRSRPQDFSIVALTAGKDSTALMALGQEFAPEFIALHDDKGDLTDYNGACGMGEVACLQAAAMEADIVVVSISGIAALLPTLTAMKHAKRLAIANKECLVSAGRLVMQSAAQYNCQIIPVDSEHNALFQLLHGQDGNGKAISKNGGRVIITASGGPFRDLPLKDFASVTVQDALKHPNWSMGKKNTIDSATMMNKGLEVIEAHHLFDIAEDKIDVLIHRQSLVHALVQYEDGSLLAHVSATDMKVPIAYALYYPERYRLQADERDSWGGLDLASVGNLQFETPDDERFPSLSLARQALRQGGAAPAILNAANEAAVEAFLQKQLNFCQIAESVQYSLHHLAAGDNFADGDIQAILHVDNLARQKVAEFIRKRA